MSDSNKTLFDYLQKDKIIKSGEIKDTILEYEFFDFFESKQISESLDISTRSTESETGLSIYSERLSITIIEDDICDIF